MPRNDVDPESEPITPEDERELAHEIMHDLGAHAIVMITVYPRIPARVSMVVSSAVSERAHPAMVDALRSCLEQAIQYVVKWMKSPPSEPAANTKPKGQVH